MADSSRIQGPVFVVGMPRSGTTLLSSMLDAHPQLAICPETHFYTRCRSEEGAEKETVEEVWECLQQQPGVQDMELSEEEKERMWSRIRKRHQPSPPDLLRALCSVYAERSGTEVWGEKTPDHLAHVPAVLRDFPEAAILCIVRDPRDVCLSLRGMPWNRASLPESASKWRRYAEASEQYQSSFPNQFREIRYEELLQAPEDVLRDSFEWLGLPFDEQVLAFHQGKTGAVDAEREPWKAKVFRPLDASNREKWREQMSVPERILVEMITSPLLQTKGYSRSARSVNASFFWDLGRLLFRTGKTIAKRVWRRWRTPSRAPEDHTPVWLRQRKFLSDDVEETS